MTNFADFPPLSPPYKLKYCRHGVYLFNENDYYMGKALDLYGEYSEGEIDLFKQVLKPGQVAVDIGANLGTHTVFFAKQVGMKGRVYAIEPQRIVFQQLVANIALNSLLNVHCHQIALGSYRGHIFVPPVDYFHQGNFGAVELTEQHVGEEVRLITLDTLELAACHFIKIDVEGMELEVLKGATKTIEKFRPIMHIENDRTEKSANLIRYLTALNYDMYWYVSLLYNPQNFAQNPQNIYGKTITINMLCLPQESKITVNQMKKVKGPDDTFRAP